MAVSRKLLFLGRAIAEMQDEALGVRERPPTQERLAAAHRAHARRLAHLERVSFARPLAVAAVALLAVVVVLFFRSAPLTFLLEPGKERGELGIWVSAPVDEPRVIAFSDGSRVRLTAGAQARVVSTNEHGARVVIERGTVRADVVPRARNDWRVIGGPFEIHVTGTSFDARWEPEREILRVTMREGHVEIRGGCLSGVRSLSAGESATISCSVPASGPGATALPVVVPPTATTEAAAAPLASVAATPPPRKALASPPAESAEPTPAAPPSWHAWVRLGAYKEALAAAENEGFDALCATLSSDELLELATTARLAGNSARARQAYSAVRARFGGSEGAATAAFHLGQIAFDGAGSYPEAHRWFVTYLGERPSGALAAEALGRSMEAEQRTGDLAAARVTAATYLRAFPTGAHVRLARSLLAP